VNRHNRWAPFSHLTQSVLKLIEPPIKHWHWTFYLISQWYHQPDSSETKNLTSNLGSPGFLFLEVGSYINFNFTVKWCGKPKECALWQPNPLEKILPNRTAFRPQTEPKSDRHRRNLRITEKKNTMTLSVLEFFILLGIPHFIGTIRNIIIRIVIDKIKNSIY